MAKSMIFTLTVVVDSELTETELREAIREACERLDLPNGGAFYPLAVDVEHGITVDEV